MNSSNDIIIKDEKSSFYFKYLEWDSNFFNKKSFLLDIEKSNLISSINIKNEINKKLKDSFISVKLDTNLNYEIASFLQDCGFYYIDTEVVLEFSNTIKPKLNLRDNLKIEKLNINKNLPYEELGSAFTLTRFHTDLNIDNSLADFLWINYIKNYKPSEDKYIFIAKINEEITGAILVNVNENIATLFFVVVLEKYRTLGIGKELIFNVINYFNGYVLRTETQIKNIKALNFYIKSGFNTIKNTSTVLHRW